VIKDNNSINETSTMKQLQDGITVVLPREEWPKNSYPAFLKITDMKILLESYLG